MVRFLSFLTLAIVLVGLLAPTASYAHLSEDDLIRQLEEQYGRPNPSEDKEPTTSPEEHELPPMTMGETIQTYLLFGYQHILPLSADNVRAWTSGRPASVPIGWDHILFVLALFLASAKFRPLLIQISAFTVAHTVSLALAVLGWVQVSGSIIEPLIALSIAFVAIENIYFKNITPWRPLVVFGFGLLHGLGFAGVLTSIGMPQGQFITGLISFNVGVEVGQLSVVFLAWMIVRWFYNRPWYRSRIAVPASALIAAIGLFWTIERVYPLLNG